MDNKRLLADPSSFQIRSGKPLVGYRPFARLISAVAKARKRDVDYQGINHARDILSPFEYSSILIIGVVRRSAIRGIVPNTIVSSHKQEDDQKQSHAAVHRRPHPRWHFNHADSQGVCGEHRPPQGENSLWCAHMWNSIGRCGVVSTDCVASTHARGHS